MGDLSDEAKMEILWAEYESRKTAASSGAKHLFSGIPDRVVLWVLIGATALGMGPETVSKLLNLMVPK